MSDHVTEIRQHLRAARDGMDALRSAHHQAGESDRHAAALDAYRALELANGLTLRYAGLLDAEPTSEPQQPTPAEPDAGFTTLDPQKASRIIYVSNDGDDSASGNSQNPVRALARAMQLKEPGAHVLLRAGHEWSERIGPWPGKSPEAPSLLGVYGDGPRPVIHRERMQVHDDQIEHFAMVGLELAGPDDIAIRWLSEGDDILFEDLLVHGCRQGLAITSGPSDIGPSNVRVRRCIIVDQRGDTSIGLYASDVQGLLVEESVFDHNGWRVESDQTIRDHNLYLSRSNADVVLRRNISARAASHGMQVRCGGLVEDNLLIQNPVNLQFGGTTYAWPDEHRSGIVRHNVIIDSGEIGDKDRGTGLKLRRLRDAEIYGNIIAHRDHGGGSTRSLKGREMERVAIRDNHIWRWGSGVELDAADDVDMQGNWFNGERFDGRSHASADAHPGTYRDPARSIDNYQGGREAFLEAVRSRQRGEWDEDVTAQAVNAHVRAGFELKGSA